MGAFPTMTIQTCLREIDVSGFTPVIKHPVFLRLGRKTQLSCVDQIFPGARHSRLEHALFVYHFADELIEKLERKGLLTPQQATNLRIGALCHDIGHPPFSHAIEFILGPLINLKKPKTHHDKAVELFQGDARDSIGRTLADVIALCGGDVQTVIDIVLKQTPEAAIISHNTLGVDKLAYLLLDSHHTGFHPQLPYMLDMFPFYYYQNGTLGTACQKLPQVMNMQRVIQDMYEFVYFDPEVMQYARILQKATELEIRDGLSAEEVWEMSEGALIDRLERSKVARVRELIEIYLRGELLGLVAEFKHQDFLNKARQEDFQMGIRPEFIEVLVKGYGNPLNLTRLEGVIEAQYDLPAHSILVVLSGDPWRLVPEDTALFNPSGQKIGTLFEQFPDHHKSLLERSNNFFSLRVYGGTEAKKWIIYDSDLRGVIEKDINQ